MTPNATQQSGTSKPATLPYPGFLPFASTPQISNVFCYIVRHYGYDGLAVLVRRQPDRDQITTAFADWRGNRIDISGTAQPHPLVPSINKLVQGGLAEILGVMRYARIEQAQYFFAVVDGELTLCDVQTALNKFIGPGMINGIFGKSLRTQEVLSMEIIDERSKEFIKRGTGTYAGDLILKPSSFKMCAGKQQPLYVEVRR